MEAESADKRGAVADKGDSADLVSPPLRAASIFGGSSQLTSESPRVPDCSASPVVLSNIEQIMLRAEQRFKEEEEAKEVIDLTAGPSSRFPRSLGLGIDTIIIDDDDDDDDDLPDEIDFTILGVSPKKPNPAASSSYQQPYMHTSPPGSPGDRTPKRLRRLSEDSLDESPSKDMLPPLESVRQPEDTLLAGRERRSTARAAPYNFKLSLQRPSDTRKSILDAKHSAAVKTNILNVAEYKGGGRRADSSELISKMLRKKRQENKRGVGSEALAAALERIERGKRMLEDGDDDDGSSISGSGSDDDSSSVSEGDYETSSSPPSSPARHRSRASPSLRPSALDKVTSVLTQNALINEDGEGQSAVDIIKQDQTEAISARKDGDVGDLEQSFWTLNRIRLPRRHAAKQLIDAHGVFSLIERYQQSDDVLALSTLLRSPAFLDAMRNLDVNNPSSAGLAASLTDFLVGSALIARSADLASSAKDALLCFIGSQGNTIWPEALEALEDALSKLGARSVTFASSNGGDESSPLPPLTQVASTGSEDVYRLKKTDRLERVSRFIEICAGLASSISVSSSATTHNYVPMFFCLLALSVDPAHASLQVRIARTLRDFVDVILSPSSTLEVDSALCERIVRTLRQKTSTTRLAYLNALPCHSLRTRTLIRNVARRLVLAPVELKSTTHTYDIIVPSFTQVLDIVKKKDEVVNPLWVPRGRRIDYVQLEASVGIFMFCFTDLILQLASINAPVVETSELRRRAFVRYKALGVEALLQMQDGERVARPPIQSPPPADSEQAGDEQDGAAAPSEPPRDLTLYSDTKKARQVYEITLQLQSLSRRIKDDGNRRGAAGLGASDAQTRAKDALQRSAFMLSYHLIQHSWKFDGEGESIRREPRQMSLNSFVRAPSSDVSSRYTTPQ